MKILVINNRISAKGGANQVFRDTCEVLHNRGHEVYYFTLEGSGLFNGGFHLREMGWINPIMSLKVFVSFLLFVTRVKPSIVHGHLIWGGLGISSVVILQLLRIPFLHTVHDYRLLCPVYTLLDGYGRICEDCALAGAKGILKKQCDTRGYFWNFAKYLEFTLRNSLVDSKKFNLLCVSNFALEKHQEYRDYRQVFFLQNVVTKKKVVSSDKLGKNYLFLGRLSREKGVEKVLEIFSKNPHLSIQIAGEGPLLESYIESYSRFDNIEFLGYISGSKKEELIIRSKCILVPSEWYENNPLSILEAQSHGKVVIASEIGGIPELIQHGVSGMLHSPFSEVDLERVINDFEKFSEGDVRKMGEEALNLSKERSQGSYYENLFSIYERVLGN